jgi:predicted Zn-ribbon and HTH transcriptional regulator
MQMPQTVRQMIIDILHEGPTSAREISTRVHIPEKEVFSHLEHIRKSLQHGNQRLWIEPARCRSCDFVFHKRERFTKPGRCPSCRGSFIDEPFFMIGT